MLVMIVEIPIIYRAEASPPTGIMNLCILYCIFKGAGHWQGRGGEGQTYSIIIIVAVMIVVVIIIIIIIIIVIVFIRNVVKYKHLGVHGIVEHGVH